MKKNTQGFTLIEIMVVVVILGIIAAFIVPKLASRPDDARIVKAKNDISTLEVAVELYKLDTGLYPTTEQGLRALIQKSTIEPIPENWREGGYIKKLSKDPWGNDYQYIFPGKSQTFDIFSFGAHGKEGGEDTHQQIGNWEHNE